MVAVDETELAALAEIERRSIENGVPGSGPHRRRRAAARDRTARRGRRGGALAAHRRRRLRRDHRGDGPGRACRRRRHPSRPRGDRRSRLEGGSVRVSRPVSDDVFDRLVVCAGLQSDVVARLVGADPSPKILPFRGEYWELAPERTDLVKRHDLPGARPAVPVPRRALHPRRLRQRPRRSERGAGAGARGLQLAVDLGEGHLGVARAGPARGRSPSSTGGWVSTRSAGRWSSRSTSRRRVGSFRSCRCRTSRTSPPPACARRRGDAAVSCSTTSRSTRSGRSRCCATRRRRPRPHRSRSPSTSSSTTSPPRLPTLPP